MKLGQHGCDVNVPRVVLVQYVPRNCAVAVLLRVVLLDLVLPVWCAELLDPLVTESVNAATLVLAVVGEHGVECQQDVDPKLSPQSLKVELTVLAFDWVRQEVVGHCLPDLFVLTGSLTNDYDLAFGVADADTQQPVPSWLFERDILLDVRLNVDNGSTFDQLQ